MEYCIARSAPTALGFHATFSAGEVDSMLDSARRKMPSSKAESAARSMLANGAIEHILKAEDFIPLFRPSAELSPLREHGSFELDLTFDIVPQNIVLPDDLTQQKVEVPAPELAYAEAVRFMERLKKKHGQSDEETLAASLGYKSFEDLWKDVFEKVAAACFQRFRAEGQSRLLSKLMGGQDIEVSERLVAFFLEEALQQAEWEHARRGKTMSAGEKDALKKESHALAVENAQAHCFLLALARREGLALSEKDLDSALENMGKESSLSQKEMRRQLEAGQGMELLRQRLEANKALALLYDKAQKIVVDAEGRPVQAPEPDGKTLHA